MQLRLSERDGYLDLCNYEAEKATPQDHRESISLRRHVFDERVDTVSSEGIPVDHPGAIAGYVPVGATDPECVQSIPA